MDSRLEVGNLVKLKSGSQTMVIDAISTESTRVNCVWHSDKGEPQERWYAADALIRL